MSHAPRRPAAAVGAPASPGPFLTFRWRSAHPAIPLLLSAILLPRKPFLTLRWCPAHLAVPLLPRLSCSPGSSPDSPVAPYAHRILAVPAGASAAPGAASDLCLVAPRASGRSAGPVGAPAPTGALLTLEMSHAPGRSASPVDFAAPPRAAPDSPTVSHAPHRSDAHVGILLLREPLSTPMAQCAPQRPASPVGVPAPPGSLSNFS